jgi:hypothetical protein
MRPLRRTAPWIAAALVCLVAIAIRQFLIQPAEVAQRCDAPTLSLFAAGPWWCSVRSAAIMTYAWGGLRDASFGLALLLLLWRPLWLALATLSVGLAAIVWYTYEPGAVAITVGALALARRQHDAR